MKLSTMISALELLHTTKQDDPEALRSIGEQLAELYKLERAIKSNSSANIFDDECYVVCASAAIDLMNIATYDIYGKLARASCPVGTLQPGPFVRPVVDYASFEDYQKAVKQQIDGIHGSIIEVGYEIVSDLWFDNEKTGDNADDGTFNHD